MKNKKISLKENPLKWYGSLTSRRQLVVLSVVIVIVGIILIFALGNLRPDYQKTSLLGRERESLLNRERSSLLEKERSLPSLLTRVKREEYPITLEGILCDNLFKYNMTNMTWGLTTCIKAEYFNITDTDYDCICYTPMG